MDDPSGTDDQPGEDDPRAIRSIALSPEDAVDAYVYGRENPGDAVLRVTPPFHGRMRARIHVYRRDDTELTGAVHLSPAAVIGDDVVADYPDLEAALADADADPDSDEAERLRKRHAESVETWRDRAREEIVETVTLETHEGPQQVEIKTLG
ncbi:hypothetical protein C488_02465 [Natrinema pellirubrum DSM 15624]|uniref:DUF8009 domain-containing protein n=1 Tax=Natrinema pellirubrum (strain DSM 15624 / CIP 106293 / JCM 10476 / NCIMB 786 / 157) TaxID=797303 RepID=L0JK94_NATP1|nr:hypothetical protein [Natrinema pellirubrum]AGB31002.1 hypothetical protein Natpe_1090 [Natrinema pellirubrum DSM 15624]ELY80949.1 hypothetical protein C488_02465 [Natrinema pellirubrum DSM 15624]